MFAYRCPKCGFSYAWNGAHCGHCHNPYPLRKAWEACVEPQWFHRHHPTTPVRQLVFFGCAAVRSGIRFFNPEEVELLERAEQIVTGPRAVGGADGRQLEMDIRRHREESLHTSSATSPTRAALDALTQLGLALAGLTSEEHVFQAAYLIATAEALAAVPETAEERAPRPAFLDDPQRRARGELSYVGGRPQLMTLSEEEQWHRWQLAMERAGHTRLVRLNVTRAATAELCELYRDVIPYPFEPARFQPEWRTTTVIQLARGISESRNVGAMPILADALQDSGCEDEQILTHCRHRKSHAHGCWVIQAVLDGMR